MQVLSETEDPRRISGPAGPLEVQVDAPRGPDCSADVVICHPHPLHGGTLDNKVVHTIARAARDRGFRAVRFNFRGVGGSVGVHDEGRGEVDDLLAVVGHLARTTPGRALVLAGFSFGAWVAAQAAVRLAVPGSVLPRFLLLAAPPVHYAGFGDLPPFAMPCLVVQGRDDVVVEAAAIRAWAAERVPSPRLETLPAGHFFHGVLPELKEIVARALDAVLPLDGELAGRVK